MKTKFTFLLASLLISLFIFQACSTKQRAKGSEDEIFVIADSMEFIQVEKDLQQTFGKIIYTPQPEELFKLQRKNINMLDRLKQRKNILIIAP
ncbi:MAG: DUF4837 domain-containing protein, partial [Ignavibacteriae bacterium]|nr:DUF4837 domain-containing protein [Ignavibacteriota bacterium]